MATRIAVTQQLRYDCRTRSKAQKSAILDQVCASTGVGQSTARRYLTSGAIGAKNVLLIEGRKHKPTKYPQGTQRQLFRVWRMVGVPTGRYLAVLLLAWLEAHDELALGRSGCNPGLGPSAHVRYLMADTVDHCDLSAKGEFIRALTVTDVLTGWVRLEVLPDNARVHMVAGLDRAAAAILYAIAGRAADGGGEFMHHEVMRWAAGRLISSPALGRVAEGLSGGGVQKQPRGA